MKTSEPARECETKSELVSGRPRESRRKAHESLVCTLQTLLCDEPLTRDSVLDSLPRRCDSEESLTGNWRHGIERRRPFEDLNRLCALHLLLHPLTEVVRHATKQPVLLEPRVEFLVVEAERGDLFEIVALFRDEFGFCRIGRSSRCQERSLKSFDLDLELADSAGVALGKFLLQLVALAFQPRNGRLGMLEVLRHVVETLLRAERGNHLGDARAQQLRKIPVESFAVDDYRRHDSVDELEMAHARLGVDRDQDQVLEDAAEKVERAPVRVGEHGFEAAPWIVEVHSNVLLHRLGHLGIVGLRVVIVRRDEFAQVVVVEHGVFVEDPTQARDVHRGAQVDPNLEVPVPQELSDEEHVGNLANRLRR